VADLSPRAACRGTDVMMLFFGPEDETPPERGIRERKAKVVCAACSLRAECLEYALQHPVSHGIWGGLNNGELSSERRRRSRRAPRRVAVSGGDR
jgi:WhiB family transcriptional regulator, redox-sensing transcriptional regulator